MKAMNYVVKPIQGIVHEVKAKLEQWSGMLNLSLVPIDNFRIVLGM